MSGAIATSIEKCVSWSVQIGHGTGEAAEITVERAMKIRELVALEITKTVEKLYGDQEEIRNAFRVSGKAKT